MRLLTDGVSNESFRGFSNHGMQATTRDLNCLVYSFIPTGKLDTNNQANTGNDQMVIQYLFINKFEVGCRW